MARKKVAEIPTPAKSQVKTKAPASTPRLHVVLSEQAPKVGPTLSSALDAYRIIGRELSLADRETFIVLHLNCKNQLLAKEVISAGSLNSTTVHPREVFKGAVLNGSAAIICAHNHPSGDPTPSQEDGDLTARLKQAAELIGIRFHDHVIVGASNYYSFSEHGTMMNRAQFETESLKVDKKEVPIKEKIRLVLGEKKSWESESNINIEDELDKLGHRITYLSGTYFFSIGIDDKNYKPTTIQDGYYFELESIRERISFLSDEIAKQETARNEQTMEKIDMAKIVLKMVSEGAFVNPLQKMQDVNVALESSEVELHKKLEEINGLKALAEVFSANY